MRTVRHTVLAILTVASEPEGVLLADVAQVLGIRKQSAHAILRELHVLGVVSITTDPDRSNRYRYRSRWKI
jgi:DNA-binding IclR family transcriptional regulator